MADVSMQKVKDLIAKKDAIEKEIKEFQDVLESQKGVGMHGKLIDEENYPRSDIDVYAVRVARNRIICLQNDHKALMKEIEEGIHEVHARAREQKNNEKENQEDKEMADISTNLKAFLRVDSVAEGSPSSQAGLKVGDHIIKFGSISAENFNDLQDIASVVQHSKGTPVSVTVERQQRTQTLSLTPNTWGGRGLLGVYGVPRGKWLGLSPNCEQFAACTTCHKDRVCFKLPLPGFLKRPIQSHLKLSDLGRNLLTDEILIMRDKCLLSQDPVKRTF